MNIFSALIEPFLRFLAKNLVSGIRNFCFLDAKEEVNINRTTSSCLNNVRVYDNLRPESEMICINSVLDEHQCDLILGLKNRRVKHFNKIVMGHRKINSIRNKFELLSSLVGGKIDILMITESKLDTIFHSRIFYCV